MEGTVQDEGGKLINETVDSDTMWVDHMSRLTHLIPAIANPRKR